MDRECRVIQKISKAQESSKIKSPSDRAFDFEKAGCAWLVLCTRILGLLLSCKVWSLKFRAELWGWRWPFWNKSWRIPSSSISL